MANRLILFFRHIDQIILWCKLNPVQIKHKIQGLPICFALRKQVTLLYLILWISCTLHYLLNNQIEQHLRHHQLRTPRVKNCIQGTLFKLICIVWVGYISVADTLAVHRPKEIFIYGHYMHSFVRLTLHRVYIWRPKVNLRNISILCLK